MLQNWGNYADMFQGVAVYTSFIIDVLLVCWFGNQLTQHVRDNYSFYSKDVTYIMRRAIQELKTLARTEESVFFSNIRPSELSRFARI